MARARGCEYRITRSIHTMSKTHDYAANQIEIEFKAQR